MVRYEKIDTLRFSELPFSLDWLSSDTYLVGGAVRDALLCRKKEYIDLDFVIPEFALCTAKKIANHYNAGFVVLDQERQIARVVFPQGTVDFAQQEGNTLEKDLQRRDFTINAIAYNLHTQTLIDPLNGLEDLKRGIIKMVSSANLEDDPLRLLRAYRQAAQLNFKIDYETRSTICRLAPLVGKVAAERFQSELNYLLRNALGNYWLAIAWEDHVLEYWLKNITQLSLDKISHLESTAQILSQKLAYSFQFTSEIILTVKLTCLVCPIPEEAELELNKIKYSRNDIRTITTILRTFSQLKDVSIDKSLRQQYFLFQSTGNIFPYLALFALLHKVDLDWIIFLMNRYLDPLDPVAHPKPLVKGNDLIQCLKIPPSPKIGKLLTELQIAQIEGKITTADEAIQLAKNWLILDVL
ncbi:[cytidine(C)-cytidine(C)-adenosine (A)]-adding enzyme [Aphanothece hegewaldii CCALA 016]|uniref:[cytidine(C)-cytidine(C)-adenosine (A)]-adding enzyme n=1 Tax=Aphanothece hegewaldii CCALA 016 TaxID=2107694 RepID=A0A2T1M189_9CHRO|nr:CCA tRNA nucleotidyltransferase [Aphanothece hegewaldii]PSF38369.1 [cytidine(C)-cytidine(C)-adenosine (A)]-adding enzyme [Aphanothece hegewaldii CCALA 016]